MMTHDTKWFDRVPKAEIHLHLEGAIPLPALWELVRKYGGDPEVPDFESLERRFEYRDFSHFIRTWVWKNRFLREYEDFTFIATEVARDLAKQNIKYVEAFFSPPDFHRHGLKTQEITQAIRTGLAVVPEISVALVGDFVRDYGAKRAEETLHEFAEVKQLGIIGVGIGGSENEFPPEAFADVYESARKMGFRTSAHAGEAAGPRSIWGAIRALHVDRIGHGTRALEDPSLLEYLATHRIPLEMCPISNVRTAVVASMEKHPIRRYYDDKLLVSVNTDDPKMFGNSLAGEYRQLSEKLGFSRDGIRSLILNAVESSWLPEDGKRGLRESFQKDPNWT